jgi:hypothetical protein
MFGRAMWLWASVLFLFIISASAQDLQSEELTQGPKTKLESFERQTGTVIIKGFANIGSVRGLGEVSVTCMELTEAANASKQYGITIEVVSSGRLEREDRSFVDYDEIESLIKGIDYISKAGPDITPLENFEAIYQTKGDLSLITFSTSPGKSEAAVRSGRIGGATAFISTTQLAELRDLILRAKQTLDSVK